MPAGEPEESNPERMDSVQLAAHCARDTSDTALWSEFLRRFGPRIRSYIRSSLRQASAGVTSSAPENVLPSCLQEEEDLFQTTIVRLVENGCLALRKFSGSGEIEFLTYLAVISRSAVRDFHRRNRAQKRPPSLMLEVQPFQPGGQSTGRRSAPGREIAERQILVRELKHIGRNVIQRVSCQFPARDKLIFELYFSEGLSIAQIAHCEGIGLSETRIKKLLHRMEELIRSAATQGSTEAVVR